MLRNKAVPPLLRDRALNTSAGDDIEVPGRAIRPWNSILDPKEVCDGPFKGEHGPPNGKSW